MFVASRACRTTSYLVARSSSSCVRMLHVEKKLEELGIELPPAPTPKANYNIVCHASGNMLYISGHLPLKADGTLMVGRIGQQPDGETVEHGYEAARHAGLNLISTMKEQLGDLDRVEQVVKVREGTMQN
jgi:enamine deaminase RidA (YjgF/YER057c/UK114 family)